MTWINGFQEWLSESQSLKNAQKVVDFLYTDDKDWSKESISALIGNMRHESSINPNMYEYGYNWSEDRGFGLVQWTPRSKYWDWGSSKGYTDTQLRSGDAQLARIDYEVDNNIQWIAKDSVFSGLTFKEFRTNSRGLSVNQLTEAFTWGYERPNQQAGESSMPDRQAFANRAFKELDWTGGGTTPAPDPDPKPEPKPEPAPDESQGGVDVRDISNILDQGKVDLLNSIEIDLQKAIDYIMKEFEKLFNHQLFNISKDYDINGYFKITHMFKNQLKINPKPKLLADMLKIVMDGLKLIEVNIDTDGVFDNIKKGIIGVFPIPEPEAVPEPDPTDPPPEPVEPATKIFPVKIQNGINFFKRSNWGAGTLQRNMTYGTRSSGKNHYGYDIGGGGVKHTLYSVTNGKVTRADFSNGIGNRVTIDNSDDKYFMEYGHCDSFLVKAGDTVKAGQPIAIMGASGGNYSIHLDLKISTTATGFYSFDTTIDPEKYLEIDKDNSTKLPQPN